MSLKSLLRDKLNKYSPTLSKSQTDEVSHKRFTMTNPSKTGNKLKSLESKPYDKDNTSKDFSLEHDSCVSSEKCKGNKLRDLKAINFKKVENSESKCHQEDKMIDNANKDFSLEQDNYTPIGKHTTFILGDTSVTSYKKISSKSKRFCVNQKKDITSKDLSPEHKYYTLIGKHKTFKLGDGTSHKKISLKSKLFHSDTIKDITSKDAPLEHDTRTLSGRRKNSIKSSSSKAKKTKVKKYYIRKKSANSKTIKSARNRTRCQDSPKSEQNLSVSLSSKTFDESFKNADSSSRYTQASTSKDFSKDKTHEKKDTDTISTSSGDSFKSFCEASTKSQKISLKKSRREKENKTEVLGHEENTRTPVYSRNILLRARSSSKTRSGEATLKDKPTEIFYTPQNLCLKSDPETNLANTKSSRVKRRTRSFSCMTLNSRFRTLRSRRVFSRCTNSRQRRRRSRVRKQINEKNINELAEGMRSLSFDTNSTDSSQSVDEAKIKVEDPIENHRKRRLSNKSGNVFFRNVFDGLRASTRTIRCHTFRNRRASSKNSKSTMFTESIKQEEAEHDIENLENENSECVGDHIATVELPSMDEVLSGLLLMPSYLEQLKEANLEPVYNVKIEESRLFRNVIENDDLNLTG